MLPLRTVLTMANREGLIFIKLLCYIFPILANNRTLPARYMYTIPCALKMDNFMLTHDFYLAFNRK